MLIKGRDNLALTIMVPYDCDNNCKFCTSKKSYAERKANKAAVLDAIKLFFNNEHHKMITDVVITGGEPMQDLYTLDEIVRLIPDGLNVYINTTLLEKNFKEFIFFVNTNPKIKGVNISRHTASYEDDCRITRNIVEDEAILKIKKPVRINCVFNGTKSLNAIIARWSNLPTNNIEISFRADFTKTTAADLHNPYDPTALFLIQSGYKYVAHTSCNVCDTIAFINENYFVIKYHRGLSTTSIKRDNNIEVNDFVIAQDGALYCDWEFSEDNLLMLPTKDSASIVESHLESSTDFWNSNESVNSCGGRISHGCGGVAIERPATSCGGRSYRGCGGSYSVPSYSSCGGSCCSRC